MARPLLFVVGGAFAIAAGLAWAVPHFTEPPRLEFVDLSQQQQHDAIARGEESIGLCGWQQPETDMHRFFSSATGYRDDFYGLAPQREEIARRLGRKPASDEGRLQVHRVLKDDTCVGTVLTRRLRGESGAMELVLAVDTQSRVVGAKVQRLREPDAVARQLQSPTWLAQWRGKTASSGWQLGKDIPMVTPEARPTAQTLLDGARSSLILLDVSRSGLPSPTESTRSTSPEQRKSTP